MYVISSGKNDSSGRRHEGMYVTGVDVNGIEAEFQFNGLKKLKKIEEPSEVTRQDIKSVARESVLRKWQNQWESSQRGRNYYNYHQKVCQKIPKDLPSKWSFSITTSLRTGYCDLNDYKSKIIPSSDKNCSCGEPETVEHYLLHCSNYEEARKRMRTSIYFITGNIHMDLDTLLGIESIVKKTLIETIEMRYCAIWKINGVW
ncbi:unnamed protein product [Mytilus edulis]|uniref:Reverse transcriptase zinc-binding domain-containing protein n=1 Tax=Mytilus edulis TaxID=6550 RepID=A0A8S3VF86_MYTED|nr:unnamed protein product [Mytilus edulis]